MSPATIFSLTIVPCPNMNGIFDTNCWIERLPLG